MVVWPGSEGRWRPNLFDWVIRCNETKIDSVSDVFSEGVD
jgi:hypothetical protein